MNQTQRITLRMIFGLLIGLLILGSITPATGQGNDPFRVFLPTLHNGERNSVVGLEMFRVLPQRGLDMVVASNTHWIRRNGLTWKDIEPVEGGGYRWDAVPIRMLESEMINASRSQVRLILVVHGSPKWAVAPYQADCAPINQQKVDNYIAFMKAAVDRYSRPPYNVKYWEIGNEPDAYVFPQDSVFGCWGIDGDPYYGGEYYGRVMKAAAIAMKEVNPEIKILNGGLLLAHPYDPQKPGENLAGRFFEGMLRVGAGEVIDIVSFHSYTTYGGSPEGVLGGRDDWRVPYLRNLLKQYGLSIPLFRTEAAILCPVVTFECRWGQADYMARLYSRAMRDDLMGSIWFIYDNDSYHSGALVEPSDIFVPRPAYFAFKQIALMLDNRDYAGPITELPADAEGYRFIDEGSTLWIFWSDRRQQVALDIPPGGTISCYDRDGGPLPCTAAADGAWRFEASSSPIYVVQQR